MKKILIISILLITTIAFGVFGTGCGSKNASKPSGVVEKVTDNLSSASTVTQEQENKVTEPATTNVTEDKINGNWIISESTLNGAKQNISDYSDVIITFDGGFFAITKNGEISLSGTYTLKDAVLTYVGGEKTGTMEFTTSNTLIAKDKIQNSQIVTVYTKSH